ncbi:MAG: 50S ribosomal protein L11 methyltransferase [Xanthobacteraceae bacterium]
MRPASLAFRIVLTLAAALCLGAAIAQEDDILLERDTPYVPTPPDVVERMLDMAAVRKGEFVIDLGSGDGRIAIAAAKRGARAFGVDLDPELVKTAQANAAKAGVAGRVSFAVRDLFKTDISKADVLTIYLLPLVNLDLRPRILEHMRPGTRVIAHAFHMGDWLPDATDNLRGRVVFYWVVPARIAGRWRIESEDGHFTIDIAQAFQRFKATAHVDRRIVPRTIEAHAAEVQDGRIDGAEVVFTVDLGEGPRVFRGRVEGDTIRGIAPQGWKGMRVR